MYDELSNIWLLSLNSEIRPRFIRHASTRSVRHLVRHSVGQSMGIRWLPSISRNFIIGKLRFQEQCLLLLSYRLHLLNYDKRRCTTRTVRLQSTRLYPVVYPMGFCLAKLRARRPVLHPLNISSGNRKCFLQIPCIDILHECVINRFSMHLNERNEYLLSRPGANYIKLNSDQQILDDLGTENIRIKKIDLLQHIRFN